MHSLQIPHSALPVGILDEDFVPTTTTIASCPEGGWLVVHPSLTQFSGDAATEREEEGEATEASIIEEALASLLTTHLGNAWQGVPVLIQVR